MKPSDLKDWIQNKTLILDGAFGTMLQKKGMHAGEKPEVLNITNPGLIQEIHKEYIDAGSDVIYANTFGANALKMKDTGHSVEELIHAALQNARQAGKPDTLVALDVGPLGELLEPMGTLSFEDAYAYYSQMMEAAKDEADLIVIETMTDLYEAKAALLAAKENTDLPVFVTMTFEPNGRTFTGCTIESMAHTLEGLQADAIGLNCSAGPDQLGPLLKELCTITRLPVIAKPNAGLPDPIDGHYHMNPESFLENMQEVAGYGVSILGGCCGTTPEYIKKLAENFKNKDLQPRDVKPVSFVCTPAHPLRIDQVRMIGERINPTGKKRFQKALLEKDFDYIISVALEEAEAGADILDVNVGYPGVDEVEMLPETVKKLQAVIDLPLQLDSSNADALEAALRIYNGKPSVNSINGNPEVQDRLLPIIHKYGASVVGLTLSDAGGIPQSAQGRFEIAKQILSAARKAGVSDEDVWIDCLVLTVSAQQDQARQTLQAVRRVHDELGLQTVLGVSNISFGLPNRPLITRTFLTQALEEGLSLPIVNPNQKEIRDAVAAFKVLSGQDSNSQAYIEAYANANPAPETAGSSSQAAPVSKKSAQDQAASKITLQDAVIKGLKNEAAALAREALQTRPELSLVEEDLIPALDIVGNRYEKGTLYLPQLLSAAGAAQSVFEVIRDSLAAKGEEEVKKGTLIMATVQGDIHDIGKNIVKTVLENYGYEVIDLGKDVDPQLVYDTVIEKDVKLVGLSALMTTTLPAMEKTIALLHTLPNPPKIMVGGAVVTDEYAKKAGADFYCRDANDSVKAAREVFQQ